MGSHHIGREHPLKIVHLIAPAPAGGAESAVRSLVIGLRRAGRDVEVVALLPPEGRNPFVERLRAEDVPVTEIRHRHRSYLAQVRDVAGILERKGVALLHTHVYHADTIGYLASRRHALPWVATFHGFTDGDLKNRAYTKLDMLLMRRTEAVVCVAETVRERIAREGIRRSRLHVIPNGYLPIPLVDRASARKRLGIQQGAPTLGWIGRLSHEKGPDLLLEAFARIQRSDVACVVVGDGPERDSLHARSAALGLDDQMRFAGRIDDAASLLAAFDAIVLSSRTEGTPMVLLEALASGVPVVAFSVGGIPSVVSDASAYLVPPQDVKGLAEAMACAVEHNDARQRRVNEARHVFEAGFSVDRCVERTSRLYDEVLAARG